MTTMKTPARAGALASFVIAALAFFALVAVGTAAPQAAPVNVDPPTITGTARAGEVLTRACFWLRTASRTGVAQADVGHALRVRVTAMNADGATNARSDSVGRLECGAAQQHRQADDQRRGPRRAGADRERGHLDG
jgi:hypothetical protein